MVNAPFALKQHNFVGVLLLLLLLTYAIRQQQSRQNKALGWSKLHVKCGATEKHVTAPRSLHLYMFAEKARGKIPPRTRKRSLERLRGNLNKTMQLRQHTRMWKKKSVNRRWSRDRAKGRKATASKNKFHK